MFGFFLPAILVGGALSLVAVAVVRWMRLRTTLSARNLYPLALLAAVLFLATLAAHTWTLIPFAIAVCPPVILAAVVGHRWRQGDLGAGAELRNHELARRWIWQRREQLPDGERRYIRGQGELVHERSWPETVQYVSLTGDGEAGPRLPLGEGHHIFFVGATGSGKTTTARRVLAARTLAQGAGLLVLDQKGHQDDVEDLRRLAAAAGRPFILFDSQDRTGTDRWQPLWGTPDKVAARAVEPINASEPYYYDMLKLHLSVVCNVLDAADRWPPSVPLLVDACHPLRFRAIAALARALDDDEHRALKRSVRDHQVYVASPDGMKALAGGGNRLKVALGLASRHVVTPRVTPDGDAVGVRLVEALHARAVVMWRTYVDTMPDEAAALTVLALSDLYDAAGAARATDPELQWTLLLDEFGGVIKLAADKAVAMLERARSSGGQVLVATQSVADVEALTGQVGLLPSLSDNFAAVVAHRQTAPESRDWLSKLMGTREIWQATNATAGHGIQHTGRGSARRANEFLVAPDEFRRLGRGQAVVFNALSGIPATAQISELHLPDHPAIRIDPHGPRDACETTVHPEDVMPELAATVGKQPPDIADVDFDDDESEVPVPRRAPAPQIDASTLGHQAERGRRE